MWSWMGKSETVSAGDVHGALDKQSVPQHLHPSVTQGVARGVQVSFNYHTCAAVGQGLGCRNHHHHLPLRPLPTPPVPSTEKGTGWRVSEEPHG